MAPEISKRTLLQSLNLGSRRILSAAIHGRRNRLSIDYVLDPVARCSNIGCVKSNFAALFDGVEALASYAVLGNDWIFHNMKCPWPHWLDQDIRRLHMHFLPNDVFGKVAMFNRVPFGSISLRDCTAKGEGVYH